MIAFNDWLKLPNEEKKIKYNDLSDSDKFKVRQGDYYERRNEKIDTSTSFMQEINRLYKEIKTWEENRNETTVGNIAKLKNDMLFDDRELEELSDEIRMLSAEEQKELKKELDDYFKEHLI